MSFTPTAEQTAAIDMFATGTDMAIQAGAGTGKTSTLLLLAELARSKGRMGQYSAFNKSIVSDTERKMPENVACNTMHSLTIRGLDPALRNRLRGSRLSPRERAALTGINSPIRVPYGSEVKVLQPGKLSGIVMRAITNFCQSADAEIDARHFPYVDGIDMPSDGKKTFANNDRIRRELLPLARRLWPKLIDPAGQLPFKHEYYLKLAQLNGLRIPVDFFLFDEAQDVSPVMAAILAAQREYGTQLIFVGDAQQSIYGFTGAIDAMSTLPADQTAYLTQSFRFGDDIADLANLILGELDAELRLKGLASIASTVDRVSKPDVVLTRTNAAAVSRVLREISWGNRPHLVGGGAEIVSFCRGALDLMGNGWTSHPELACFTSWGQVQDYVEQDDEGDDLALNVKLIDEFGADVILGALDGNRMPQEKHADVVISTAHKSKGREWDRVQLAYDFPKSLEGERPLTDDELRLMYVAVTRAKHELDVTACGALVELMESSEAIAAGLALV